MNCFEKRRRQVQNILAKRDKLGMLEALVYQQEQSTNPDQEYLRDLKRRVHEVRVQIAVMSK